MSYPTQEIKEKFNNLTPAERDGIYRLQLYNYTKEDVEGFCEENGYELTDDQIDNVTNRYVYEGEYECNLDYWQNIENLVQDELRR